MKRLSDLLDRVGQIGLIAALAAMSGATFLQVLFRYVLNLPLFWTEEFARYCLIWSSLLGAGVALKRGEHIAVTFLRDRLPFRIRRLTAWVAWVFVAAIVAVMLVGGVQLVLVTKAQISPALRIPMAVPYLAIPLGSLIMLVHVLSILIHPPASVAGEDPCRL